MVDRDSVLHYKKKGVVGTTEEIVDILTVLSHMLDAAFPDTPVISSLGKSVGLFCRAYS